jgi:hypothetical protein
MGVLVNSREFRRRYNGLLIYLHLEEWPSDIPLPTGTRVVETGDGPFDPYWRFVFEPDRTVEVVVGWFILPLPLPEAMAWYRTEMARGGWRQVSGKGYCLPESALVCFQRSEANVQVGVDLRQRPERAETNTMIRRVVVHPWQAPQTTVETATAQEPEEPIRQDEEAAVLAGVVV